MSTINDVILRRDMALLHLILFWVLSKLMILVISSHVVSQCSSVGQA